MINGLLTLYRSRKKVSFEESSGKFIVSARKTNWIELLGFPFLK